MKQTDEQYQAMMERLVYGPLRNLAATRELAAAYPNVPVEQIALAVKRSAQ